MRARQRRAYHHAHDPILDPTLDPTLGPTLGLPSNEHIDEHIDEQSGPDRMSTLIGLEEVRYSYTPDRPVIGPLSLQIKQGDITAVLGPSGCGKSTLLRLIAALRPPSGGTIRYEQPVQFGFVFQHPTLLDWRSARDNVALPLLLNRRKNNPSAEKETGQGVSVAAPNADQIANAWLDRMGLRDSADQHPRALSGGMQMRVSIARAMAAQPDCLLFDEPFAALDELTRFDLNRMVRSVVRQEHLTALFVTHSVQESVFLADRVLILPKHAGPIIADLSISGPAQRNDEWRADPLFLEQTQAISAILREAG